MVPVSTRGVRRGWGQMVKWNKTDGVSWTGYVFNIVNNNK